MIGGNSTVVNIQFVHVFTNSHSGARIRGDLLKNMDKTVGQRGGFLGDEVYILGEINPSSYISQYS